MSLILSHINEGSRPFHRVIIQFIPTSFQVYILFGKSLDHTGGDDRSLHLDNTILQILHTFTYLRHKRFKGGSVCRQSGPA
jgi:hypothetical protein